MTERFPSMQFSGNGYYDNVTNSYIRLTKTTCHSQPGYPTLDEVFRNMHFEGVINAQPIGRPDLATVGRIVVKFDLLTGDIPDSFEDDPNVSPGGVGKWSIVDVFDTVQQMLTLMTAAGISPAAICPNN